MSTAPSTFKGNPENHGPGNGGIDWDDPSSLHRGDDGGGLLHDLKTVRHGTLAELIRFVMTLPEEQQSHYAIEKSGDHRLSIGEIRALSRRSDFPGG